MTNKSRSFNQPSSKLRHKTDEAHGVMAEIISNIKNNIKDNITNRNVYYPQKRQRVGGGTRASW